MSLAQKFKNDRLKRRRWMRAALVAAGTGLSAAGPTSMMPGVRWYTILMVGLGAALTGFGAAVGLNSDKASVSTGSAAARPAVSVKPE